ncbi:exonuclease [Ensifer adhaerens]|uniref:YqaJ viral recombinase family protein n=1 Tax=Ensifer adhaerens TaxID=106592 RepID=A0ABY8HE83_ENSAD|nr:lambda exonuclease family protein [Ensifer adhaerens]ANK73764.1 exonuclease [Ensifer adhaerens]KDP70274.1 exonuclease [Ensifer adhaerens]WFP89850.1 YqaJ viral recombinase family protein [Ensifer adhaerens]
MVDIVQGSDAWHMMRLGKVTASRVADVIAKTQKGYAASRANYAAQLITERLTLTPTEGFTNAAMQWGTDMEPEARSAYEFYRAEEVEQVPFVNHPTIGDAGASPDGLVGTDGLVEIKCPLTATHIETLTGRAAPAKYITQMQWQMACTGRKWCDFVSYDPRMPESMRFFCVRVERDDQLIAELEAEVIKFLAEVRTKVDELKRLYDPEPVSHEQEYLMAGE